MLRYIINRLGQTIIVLFVVTIIAFLLIRLAPGNPALLLLPDTATPEQVALMEQQLGMDKPLVMQYFSYLNGLLHGDLGYSIAYRQPAAQIIFARLPNTIVLAFGTVIFACILAIPLGIIAGANRGKPIDVFAMFFALLGQSMAAQWLAVLLIYVFAVWLGWLPALGTGGLKYLILPVITMGYPMAATSTRIGRSGMVDTLAEDYITATYAKGIGKYKVYTKYAFRNAVIPIVTMMGLSLGVHLGGSVVVETVFSYSGIGQLLNQSVNGRDYAVVQSLLLISAFYFAFFNIVVDIINSFIDPRLSRE